MLQIIADLERKSPSQAGIIYGFLCTVCFFMTQIFAKIFKDTVHFSQIGFVRGVCLFSAIFLISKSQNVPLYPRDRFWRMTLRNILGYQTSLGLYWGVTKIPISQNTMMLQIAPLFVPLVDRIIYKTTYTIKEILLSLVAIIGVYMVLTGKEIVDQDKEYYVQGQEKVIVVIILFFSITMGYTISAVLVKEVKDVNPFVINVNFALCGLLTSAMFEIYCEKFVLSMRDLCLLIVSVGFVGFFSQHFFIKSFQLSKPGRASIINCMNIIYAFLFEIIVYNEYPNLIQLSGAIMCVTCVIWSLTLRI